MSWSDWEERLERALKKTHPYAREQEFRLPEGIRARATDSAVLLLLHPMARTSEPAILLTKRSEHVAHHKGQISFPGGVADPVDFEQGQGLVTTALRETREEIGVESEFVRIVGGLPPLLTVTGFRIHPFVGRWAAEGDPRIEILTPETELVFWAPLAELTAPGTYRQEWVERLGRRFPTDVYYVGGHRIWGATGSLLRNFIERLDD